MSVFQRGNVWWYTFRFKGMRVQESTSSASKNLAIKAERVRRRELEEGINRVKADKRPKTFSVHSTKYLKTKELKWSDANRRIEGYNVDHLTEFSAKCC